MAERDTGRRAKIVRYGACHTGQGGWTRRGTSVPFHSVDEPPLSRAYIGGGSNILTGAFGSTLKPLSGIYTDLTPL